MLSCQSSFEEPQAAAAAGPAQRAREYPSASSSMLVPRLAAGVRAAASEPAAASSYRDPYGRTKAVTAVPSAEPAGSSSKGTARRRFPPCSNPAEHAVQAEAAQLSDSDRSHIDARFAQTTICPAQLSVRPEAGSAQAIRTQFAADCLGRPYPGAPPANTSESRPAAGQPRQTELLRGCDQQTAAQADARRPSPAGSHNRQPSNLHQAHVSAAEAIRSLSARGGRHRGTGQPAVCTGSRSNAAVCALLALCVLCSVDAAAAAPVVRAAVTGNATTSNAILVRKGCLG